MDFRRESPARLAEKVRGGTLSARELVTHALERIESLNGHLNAFVAVDGGRALETACRIDDAVAAGTDPGPLAGLPIGVKDLEDAEGFVTSHGSALFASTSTATRDSLLVARLRAAGCVVLGKTNTPEFGWKADTDNATFGRSRNPWNPDHTAGGSSGGTAVALAAGMIPLGTGSDGGGSIRIPSSCCGLSGIKPSLGRVPAGGPEPPGWPMLSTKGPMTRRIADVVEILDVCIGPDPSDLSSLPRQEHSWTQACAETNLPKRIGWSPTLGYAVIDDEVRDLCERAMRTFESLGTEVTEVPGILAEDPVGDWLRLTLAYSLRTLTPHRGRPEFEKVDPQLLEMLFQAERSLTPVDLVEAIDACHRVNYAFSKLFGTVDLLVTPTCAAPPPPVDLGGAGLINGQVDYNWVRFTYPFNMTGLPAASICAGLTARGLPVGLQLVGPQHSDLTVLRAASALEDALGFDDVAPVD